MDILQTGLSVLAPTINSISQEMIRATFSAGTSRFKNLLVKYENGFSEYANRLYERCSMVKTLLHRYQPINIDEIYIEANLSLGSKKLSEAGFLRDIKKFRRSIVTGSAGSGKSLLLKHLAVHFCTHAKGQLPVYAELRHLNSIDGQELEKFITSQFSNIIPEFKEEQFLFALESGKLVLLLDAIDEIEPKKREIYSRQIIDLATKYPNSTIIVSSRPDDRFMSWHNFHTFEISEFSEKQVLAFVDKIPYDETVKSNFKRLVPTIYQTHESFLSNPLLCTMMLMTFDEFADVPQRMHIFYDQALDVLFKKHDASKSFVRQLYTDLSVEDFRTIFETFCLVSYLDSNFSMTERMARAHIDEALRFEEKQASAQLFLRDLQDSFGIMLRDGLEYSFLHRSIQEYCTASFLIYRQGPGIYELFDKIVMSGWSDDIVGLLYDIDRDVFEQKFLSRKLEEFSRVIEGFHVQSDADKIFRMLYLAISVDSHTDNSIGFTINDNTKSAEWFSLVEIAERHYKDIWKEVDDSWPSNETHWAEALCRPGTFEIGSEEITAEMLKDTPMIKYLTAVISALAKIKKSIDTRIRGRSLRVASILQKH